MSDDRFVQMPMFTPGGEPYSLDALARELRVGVCRAMQDVYGSLDADEERCPDCEGGLTIVPHLTMPFAYCTCGWFETFTPEEIFAEEEE